MKNKMRIICSVCCLLVTLEASTLEQDLIDAKIQELAEILVSEGGEIEQLNLAVSDQEKIAKFNKIIASSTTKSFSRLCSHPTLDSWPLVDWEKVVGLDNFFEDQFLWLAESNSIAIDEDEMAENGVVTWLISSEGGAGKLWAENWLLTEAQDQASTHLRLLLYWFTENFGEDIHLDNQDGKVRDIDWNKWKNAFNNTDELGKAIILRNLSTLASRTDGWEEAADIHLSVFNGESDELKAIAIAKGDKSLGAEVLAKWQDIVENSQNAKLKLLAQEALALQPEEGGLEES